MVRAEAAGFVRRRIDRLTERGGAIWAGFTTDPGMVWRT
jgi:hypothetical protein